MSDLLEYKCPNCGGAISFDSATQKMKCPYCDSEFDMEALQSKDAQLETQQPDAFEWQTQETEEWNDSGMSVFVCKSCGGEIVCDETTAASACPYCGNPVVMSGRLSGMLKPDYVIPFQLDSKAAKETLKRYIGKKKFAPSSFKSENRLNEIKGLYVPFWLFDSDAAASASFTATRIRSWSDAKYYYTETSYFDVFRSGNMRFENIPVDGSAKMPDDLMESIEPFDFSGAVSFQTAYLSGYLADKYDVSMEDSIERANQRIKASAEDALRSTVDGYNSVTVNGSSVQSFNGTAKYALYPVWLLNTEYRGEKFTFAMNGQTGRLVGNLPVSRAKLAGLFAGLGVALTPIVYVIVSLFGLV